MKKATTLLLGILLVGTSSLFAQHLTESDGLRMPGDWNSWTNTLGMGGDFDFTKISTGTTRWQTTFQFTGTTGTQNFKWASGGSGFEGLVTLVSVQQELLEYSVHYK